jgi:hypothetical protein
MSPKKKKSSKAVAVVAGGVIVAVLWTLTTGSLWQWIPIMGGVAVILYAFKILDGEQ